jgi:hypothetical protein
MTRWATCIFLGRAPAHDDLSAWGHDSRGQRRQLVTIAPAREDDKIFRREFFGNGGADIVAGSDHRRRRVALLHAQPSGDANRVARRSKRLPAEKSAQDESDDQGESEFELQLPGASHRTIMRLGFGLA